MCVCVCVCVSVCVCVYYDLLQLPEGVQYVSGTSAKGTFISAPELPFIGEGGGGGGEIEDEHGQLTTVKMLMKTVCYMSAAILDIPVYKTSSHQNEKIQALHVLFTLYSEFKNSQVTPSLFAHRICLHKLPVCS